MSASNASRTPHGDREIGSAFTWGFGLLSGLLTAFFVYLVATVINEWSDYEGGESRVALFVLGLVGVVTLVLWSVTAVGLLKSRAQPHAAWLVGTMTAIFAATMLVLFLA